MCVCVCLLFPDNGLSLFVFGSLCYSPGEGRLLHTAIMLTYTPRNDVDALQKGYQLGELNEWSKKTDTELAAHIPLLIKVPWKKASIGARTVVKAELVDMYRTLADLAELTTVPPAIEASVQGTSLAAAFDAPTSLPANLQAKRAFSQIGRCSCNGMYPNKVGKPGDTVKECGANACCKVPLGQFNYMGYSMRTETMRFTSWVPFDNHTNRVAWQPPALVYHELYNLSNDDGRNFDYGGYSANVAGLPKNVPLVTELLAELQDAVASWY